MQFISKSFDSLSLQYNFNELLNIDGDLTRLYIASAYSDSDTIENIIKLAKKSTYLEKLSLFVDKNASRATLGQNLHNPYSELSKEIENYLNQNGVDERLINQSGIFLVNLGKLFHSKIIYLESDKKIKVIIGSINITENGTVKDGNEEVVAIYEHGKNKDTYNTYIQDIKKYFKLLYSKSKKVTNQTDDIKNHSSLRDIFLSGKLYIRYTNSNLFNFNLDFDENLYEKISIDPMLHQANSINLLKFCHVNIDNVDKRVELRRYCLETCNGFWAPKEFIPAIEQQINNRDQNQRLILQEQLNYIRTTEFKKKMKSFFHQLSIKIYERHNYRWPKDKKSFYKKWDNFYQSRCNMIFDRNGVIKETIITRLISNIYPAKVPDVWNETVLTDEFETSVVDSLQSQFNSNKKTNYIAKAFIDKGMNPGTIEELSKMMPKVKFKLPEDEENT